MDKVLLATDSDETAEETFAALLGPETSVSRATRGEVVREVAAELEPDLVILDLQIGNMGGVAASLDLRHEITAGRLKPLKIILLLDREAATWIATEAKHPPSMAVSIVARKRSDPRREDGDPDQREMVGQAGFEPTTSSSRTRRATNLRHYPYFIPERIVNIKKAIHPISQILLRGQHIFDGHNIVFCY